jgi:hypothetical protein
MLCWSWFSRRDRGSVAVVFAAEGCLYLMNGCLQPIRSQITHDIELKFFEVLLTLIFRFGRWPYHILFCQFRLPILLLSITTTKSLSNDHTYKTKNCWCSVDAHLQDVTGSVSRILLPLKASNISSMDDSNQSEVRLPPMENQHLLTPHVH